MVQECAAGPRRRTGRLGVCQWIQGGFARCRLCPFRFKTSDPKVAQNVLGGHFRTHHTGHTPSGVCHFHQPMPSIICELSADQDRVWQCKFCSQGISVEAARSAGVARIARDNRSTSAAHTPACRGSSGVKQTTGTGRSPLPPLSTEPRLPSIPTWRALGPLGGRGLGVSKARSLHASFGHGPAPPVMLLSFFCVRLNSTHSTARVPMGALVLRSAFGIFGSCAGPTHNRPPKAPGGRSSSPTSMRLSVCLSKLLRRSPSQGRHHQHQQVWSVVA